MFSSKIFDVARLVYVPGLFRQMSNGIFLHMNQRERWLCVSEQTIVCFPSKQGRLQQQQMQRACDHFAGIY
jgi:hypothetical protein